MQNNVEQNSTETRKWDVFSLQRFRVNLALCCKIVKNAFLSSQLNQVLSYFSKWKILTWLRFSSPYSCRWHFSCSPVNTHGAKVSFFDDGFERQYNEDSTRIEELRIYIELYHCMKITLRCPSPRFLAVKFQSNKRALITSFWCLLTLFLDWMTGSLKPFEVINTHVLILRIMGKRSCMKIGSLAEYVLFYLIVHNLNGLFPVEKL